MSEFIVSGVVSPMRLDRYLRIIDSTMTQGFIEKALRAGDIRIGSSKAKANDRVNDGDVILIKDRIHVAAASVEVKEFSAASIALASKLLKPYLLYDDKDFMAINKPAGLPTQGGSNISLSIDHALQYLNANGHDLRLVHRLDKETTGVLLIAKNRHAATLLGEGFKNHVMAKKYIAVLYGSIDSPSGVVESYLAKRHNMVYEVDASAEDGKLAITEYSVLKANDKVTLVEFTPKTGRMHQISCHAAYSLKAPILGDEKYGGKYAESLYLHAAEITIPKEILGREHVISADLPAKYEKSVR
ncbi:MAG: RluA family pseudouridine synthase [Pseudomonadota bacterium]